MSDVPIISSRSTSRISKDQAAMTRNEIAAFNRGVAAVLAIADRTAQAIRAAPHYRPTRDEFAAEALAALAEEGRALLLDDPDAEPVVELPAPNRPSDGVATIPVVAAATEWSRP